ncbi:MAG TPA: PKD domain-containing protein [Chryseolinea sp.]|nr:PKD domain-containing protein [Chryseolinea sp.]
MKRTSKHKLVVTSFMHQSRILFLLIFPLGLFAQNVVPDHVERTALLAIYNNTGGANWNVANRWTVSKINSYPDSALHGVSVVNGDIASIQLFNATLTGTLPAELNSLTELTVLQISFNSNSLGELPALGALTKLKTLDFSNTGLSGNIPSWLGSLSGLEVLNLSGNPASVTKLNGPIPPQLAQLTNLKQLYLSNNNLSQSGSIPNALSDLDNLTLLELQNCQLTASSVGSGLSGLVSLQTLNLSGNASFAITGGTFPDVLYNLPNLRTLALRSVNLQRLPAHFDDLPITSLDLSSNYFSDTTRLRTVIDSLKNLSSVTTLHLVGCSISALPSNIAALSSVKDLYLTSNPLQPVRCEALGAMPALKNLYLNLCNLTTIPGTLVNVQTLEGLYLSNNNLSEVPVTIRDIPALKALDLTSNGITALPSWFGTGDMISLETLTLNGNQLEELPGTFSGLVNLKSLSIAANWLTGVWPAGITDLNKVESLNLQDNQIDSLPNLTDWTALRYVQLQNNELSGIVPAYLTQATSPKLSVNISDNTYNNAAPGAHFNTASATLVVQNNHFTFEGLLGLKPISGNYVYTPQLLNVDQEKEVTAFAGSTLTLVAAVDTTTGPATRYQWFKYVDGTNDQALNETPSGTAYRYALNVTLDDHQSRYYYKITNTLLPALTLVSKLQTLVITCDLVPTIVDFSAERYLCATNFVPQVTYPSGCRTNSYTWNFGDNGTSSDKSPFHAYGSGGTYSVDMTVQYTCGGCIRDTTITRQVTYGVAGDVLVDSLISVSTDKKLNVISASAATFSDSWPMQHRINTAGSTGFAIGTDGVWRNEGTYAYDVTRKKSPAVNIATDGTFDLDHFNWEQADANAVPHWIKANTMTEYSPYSYELENRDVLGVYAAALYDYGGHLPSANGVNMRNNEMAFTGFEHLDQQSSGNWVFGTQALPAYYLYDVYSANKNIAIVRASLEQLENVNQVDVSSRPLTVSIFTPQHDRYNFIADNEIVCMQPYPNNPQWSMIVLRKSPYPGLWKGTVKVKNQVTPVAMPDVNNAIAHSGTASLRVSAQTTFEQPLIRLDSGRAYYVNAWVSVNNSQVPIPKLADNLGFNVVLKDKNGVSQLTKVFEPSGNIIEGWQQIKGTFVCPYNGLKVSIGFRPGGTGTAWYDDLRLHPEKGNMKSYVYDLKDYRLRAILDEENFATFFYYDQEGNLYLTKKETERGVVTISENISYMVETNHE